MMEKRRKVLDQRAMEQAINKIRGVYAAQVVLSDNTVEEIHVIASPLRKPKQIVRDIESMLLVNFGVRVDYRRISLVQMQEERLFQAEGRPRLVAVRCTNEPNKRAEVELEKDGNIFVGTAQSNEADTTRLVSMATIEAMGQVLGERVTYHIEDIVRLTIGGMRAIAVAVAVTFETGKETLLGICQVHEGNELEAAARATLSAVNRRLLILKQEPLPQAETVT